MAHGTVIPATIAAMTSASTSFARKRLPSGATSSGGGPGSGGGAYPYGGGAYAYGPGGPGGAM
ncbi:hypothetical protein GCM10023079_10940 [Streptomyces chitinivorans]